MRVVIRVVADDQGGGDDQGGLQGGGVGVINVVAGDVHIGNHMRMDV